MRDKGDIPDSAETKTNYTPKEKLALSRAAESLRQRVGDFKEYEVISETAKEESKKPVFESWIWSAEYNDALVPRKRTESNNIRAKVLKMPYLARLFQTNKANATLSQPLAHLTSKRHLTKKADNT